MIIKRILIVYIIMIFKRSAMAKFPYKRFMYGEEEGYEYNNMDDWYKDILRDSHTCPDCTIPTALIYFHTPTPLFYLHTPALIFISKLAKSGKSTKHTTHSNAAHTKKDGSEESNTEAPNSNESTNGPSNEGTTDGEKPTNEESKSNEHTTVVHTSTKHTSVEDTQAPTTEKPTIENPTTKTPTTEEPTTVVPTTVVPTTEEPTTEEPTTEEPTTVRTTTKEPTTEEHTTIRTWSFETTTTTLVPIHPKKLTGQDPCEDLPGCLIKQKTTYDIHKYFRKWRISDSNEVTLTPKLQFTKPWKLRGTQNTPIPNLPRFGIVAIPPDLGKQMVTNLDYDEVANNLKKLNWITIF